MLDRLPAKERSIGSFCLEQTSTVTDLNDRAWVDSRHIHEVIGNGGNLVPTA